MAYSALRMTDLITRQPLLRGINTDAFRPFGNKNDMPAV